MTTNNTKPTSHRKSARLASITTRKIIDKSVSKAAVHSCNTGLFGHSIWFGPDEDGIPLEDFIHAHDTDEGRGQMRGRSIFYVIKINPSNKQLAGGKYYHNAAKKEYFYKLGVGGMKPNLDGPHDPLARLKQYIRKYGTIDGPGHGVKLVFLAYTIHPQCHRPPQRPQGRRSAPNPRNVVREPNPLRVLEKQIADAMCYERKESMINGIPQWEKTRLMERRGVERFRATFSDLIGLLKCQIYVAYH